MYEQRFLLYVDILGWSTANKESGENPRLLEAVDRIHLHAEGYSERHKQDIRDEAARSKGKLQLFPAFFEVQFGAFSDHFVYSMPVGFGRRIVTTASKLIVDLLRMGWLTRGAIVLGPLHHKDNVIFGPALLEAVEMEARHSIYPRVLISNTALAEIDEWPDDPRYKDKIQRRWSRYARSVHSSWRMDETAVSVRGGARYLYRAVDKYGKTVDSLLCEDRSELSARDFFTKALRTHQPRGPTSSISTATQPVTGRCACCGRRSRVAVRPDPQSPLSQQHRRAGPSRNQATLCADAGHEVLSHSRDYARRRGARASNSQTPVHIRLAGPAPVFLAQARMGTRAGVQRRRTALARDHR